MIIICKNNKLNRYLEKYISDFINYNNYNNNKIIGIDFEFNRVKDKREIALCQINFDYNNKSDVFLFYPPNIDKDIFRKLLTQPKANNLIKILHGAESLDLPYLYSNILTEKDIDAFCNNLFDTRYMCEYYNSINNIDGKCKIYDLLLSLRVIDKQKYDELMENDKLIGNIWDVFIDVRNLSKEVAKYSAYDVIYLPDLYRAFITSNNNDVYKKIIPDMSCVAFNLRYNNKLNEISETLSKYNLNRIDFYNNQMSFNDIYIIIFEWIKINNIILNNLYNINYFKKIIEFFIKNIIYNKLDSKIKIFDFNIKNNYLYLTLSNIINSII